LFFHKSFFAFNKNLSDDFPQFRSPIVVDKGDLNFNASKTIRVNNDPLFICVNCGAFGVNG